MDRQDRLSKKNKEFLKANDSNLDVMNKIKDLDPSLAKHLVYKNDIVIGLAKVSGGGIDLLNQPICERCEKVATWDRNDTCHCFSCGHNTKNPMTIKDHFLKELDNLPKEIIASLGKAAYLIKEEER